MAVFIEELKREKVLLNEDVRRLRRWIQQKYPQYDSRRQATILVDALHQITERYLAGLPLKQRQQIKEQLLYEYLPSSQRGLYLIDIFQSAVNLAGQEEEALQSLVGWVNAHVTEKIDSQMLVRYRGGGVEPEESFPPFVLPWEAAEPEREREPEGEAERQTGAGTALPAPALSKRKIALAALLALTLFSAAQYVERHARPTMPVAEEVFPLAEVVQPFSGLPAEFRFIPVNEDKLKEYLASRNSMLGQEPYFSAITQAAEAFELNPLVLFAIAGHEQGFVPQDHPQASHIANNPFNVFGSWQAYNTTIDDAAEIAARTVVNLAEARPEEMDPFQWVNRRYAEDPNWWEGVRKIFDRLGQVQEESSGL